MKPTIRLSPNEEHLVGRMIDHNLRLRTESLDQATGATVTRRAQHPKHHGCVRATFIVDADIPDRFQKGIFTTPGRKFHALIRFSNGRQEDDRAADAHGMAIKLTGSTNEERCDTETLQDFILIDNECFFSNDDLAHYEKINKAAAKGTEWLPKLLKRILSPSLYKRVVKFGLGRAAGKGTFDSAARFANQLPATPLSTHYWSTTPYKLGDEMVIKYMASCDKPESGAPLNAGQHCLAESLVATLSAGNAEFTFLVDVQNDPQRQPIDDSRVNWHQEGATRQRLARIEIPRQVVADNAQLAERLAYSPWHCLDAHEPLGKINHARKRVYTALSASRP